MSWRNFFYVCNLLHELNDIVLFLSFLLFSCLSFETFYDMSLLHFVGFVWFHCLYFNVISCFLL